MDGHVFIINKLHESIDNFSEVMGRNVRCHTYSDTRRTIHQKIWYLTWHYSWFHKGVIVVWYPIYGFLIEITDNISINFGHSRFGVTHSSGRITIKRTKVTLTVYKWIAKRKGLSHPNDGVIGSSITMWMVLTNNVTDNSR